MRMRMSVIGGVWTIGQIEVQKNRKSWQTVNLFAAIAIDDEEEVTIEQINKTRARARSSSTSRN